MPHKVINAYYTTCIRFDIPELDYDLDDKTIVKEYWIKFHTLYVEFVDEQREMDKIDLEINDECVDDYKHPDRIKIDEDSDDEDEN